ncbi:F-box domain [Macleaya cordata]|uniref:F-box domain n=1 Tax=Macleaya cordata TaxID=56857 RepID=A0A200PMV0_MACCD|nr:F-box domain [Macleaya cordata]
MDRKQGSSSTVKMMVDSSTLQQMFEYINLHKDDYFFTNNNTLPEEVWFEILVRLPMKSIFKFRSVSKQWLSIVSNPLFKTRRLNICSSSSSSSTTIRPPLSSTFFFYFDVLSHQRDSGDLPTPPDFDVIQSISIKQEEDQRSAHNNNNNNNHDKYPFTFIESSTRIHKKGTYYLSASSNGLILLSDKKNYAKYYLVCNPLNKEWCILPLPGEVLLGENFKQGLICEESSSSSQSSSANSSSSSSTVYKVVLIHLASSTVSDFDIEVFSSDTGEWNYYKVSCPQEIEMCNSLLNSNNVVTVNGVLYWFEKRSRIIAYDLNKSKNNGTTDGGQCRLIDLPNERLKEKSYCRRLLGESEGLLCYCQTYSRVEDTLSVWVLEEEEKKEEGSFIGYNWRLFHKIEWKDMIPENKFEAWFIHQVTHAICNLSMMPLAFDPADRNIVLLGSIICVVSYNIRTRRLKVIHKVPHHYSRITRTWKYWHYNVFPYLLPPWPTPVPLPPKP